MESESRKPNSEGLQILPTELLLSVFEYLDTNDKRAFSRCSRACYFLTFRLRIRGIYWQSCYDTTTPTFLRRFEDGQSFSPLVKYIKSAKFDFKTIQGLSAPLTALSKFPAITSIKICLGETYYLERNLYVKILCLLITLPYYDNLIYLGFEWRGDEVTIEWDPSYDREYIDDDPHELDSGAVVDSTYRIEDRRAETLKELHPSQWERRSFEWAKIALCEEEFLGKYVSPIGLNQLVLRGEVRLPKGLQSLQLGIPKCEPSFYLPLLRCEEITTLFLSIPSRETAVSPIYPELNTTLELPRIKDLTLYFHSANFFHYEKLLKQLPRQFPNITSLTSRGVKYVGTFLVPLPDFPKLESLDLDVHKLWEIEIAENPLKNRLEIGGYPELKMFKLTVLEADEEVQMICSISRFKGLDGSKEAYGFHWEELRNGHLSVMVRKESNNHENEEV
ncbi:hypothetical protein TWF192_000092 [Orbilia oligospora]|uniref:Uncharacterized protein n=1 Tax=Orbilia oligospora TaxID=2813651 RepID=A0A6G1MQJ3_ORBOL|nr:hypothetical protein TWF191_006840 [Orbilia oligospora]KAF3265442.1 hypothetical protein TWF192_000092 [Orbilia oligospora]